jgi:hypothetical protein
MASTLCSALESNLKRENLERQVKSMPDNFKLLLMNSPKVNGVMSSSHMNQFGLLEPVKSPLQSKLKKLMLRLEIG